MTGTYDDHGIRFEYLPDWELEVTEDGPLTTVEMRSTDGPAFAFVSIDETRRAPAEVADEALGAMREEYPGLDAVPALETIAGQRAVGHDVEFFSLDMTNSCLIRCFRTQKCTILLFAEWSDLEAEESEAQIQSIRRSLEVTD